MIFDQCLQIMMHWKRGRSEAAIENDLTLENLCEIFYDIKILKPVYQQNLEEKLKKVMQGFLDAKEKSREIEVGCFVEILSGAFKGEKARIVSVSDTSDEVSMDLYELSVPMRLNMLSKYVRVFWRPNEWNEGVMKLGTISGD